MSNIVNSRKISDLHPFVMNLCKQHILNCAKRGVKIIVTDVMRSDSYQEILFNKGRTTGGNIVTWTKTTYAHGMYDYNGQFKSMAYDVAPMSNDGKSTDYGNRDKWKIIIEEGKKLKLEHGTEVFGKQDDPHWQLVQGITKAQLKSGKRPSYWNKPINQPKPKPLPIKPTEPQSAIQSLFNHRIISDIVQWESNIKNPNMPYEHVKWLIINFHKNQTGKVDNNYIEAVNYLLSQSIITSKSYWIDKRESVDGEYVKILIDRMASKLK